MFDYMSELVSVTYKASAKLMLFGEYMVLHDVKSIAIPLKYGQYLTVTESVDNNFHWKSYNEQNQVWFDVTFNRQFELVHTSNTETAQILMNLMQIIAKKNPRLFEQPLIFEAKADFNLNWGLGSSSTLISLLAQWSNHNPFDLLSNSFGGSGYDVACATEDSPICYKMSNQEVSHIRLSPAVTNRILFVYIGNKQNSKREIKRFSQLQVSDHSIQQMNQVIENVLVANEIVEFERCMNESEQILASILEVRPLKELLFPDYPFMVKSMGAWGGDFFMATYRDEAVARKYFSDLGYTTQFTYSEIIKN